MSETDQCARCGGDCPMTRCPECGGCENTGTQPCPACQAPGYAARDCEICEGGAEECHYCGGDGGEDDYDSCFWCGGSGYAVPDHCCACGGSPYCACCPACGASCIADCRCPVTVQRADGSTLTLGPAEVPHAAQ